MATLGDIVTINATEAAEVGERRRRKREQDRERQQRQRERRAAERVARDIAGAEAKRLEAIETERKAERMAPAVLRNAVMEPAGRTIASYHYAGVKEEGASLVAVERTAATPQRMLRGPLVNIVDGRPQRGQDFPFAPERSRRAARHLQLDWQDVGSGLNSGAVDYLRTGGGGDGLGGHIAMRAQIDTRARLDAALTHLGALAPVVCRVVLDCVPIPVWTVEENERRVEPLTPEGAVQFIAGALRRLGDFYWPPKEQNSDRQGFMTIGPDRGAYHVAGEYEGEDFDERGRIIGACTA